MGVGNFAQTSFLGGEWAPSSQGGHDRPEYRTALNVCTNGFPMENRAWVRRPGFQHGGHTRGGGPGRLIPFTFQESAPYNMEFTDGHLRFWAGPSRVPSLDQNSVVSISTANPAVVETFTPHGWNTGDCIFFSNLGLISPPLQNKVFAITVTDTTHFSIADALTGVAVNGAALGFTGAIGEVQISRILDFVTPYVDSAWKSVRSVQSEKKSFLLQAKYQPRVLSVVSDPLDDTAASFSLDPINLIDGPYFDPVQSLRATAGSTNGLVSLTLSFAAYDSARAYSKGDFVTSSGTSYKSLQDVNLNHAPASNIGTWWAVASPGDAVGPNGFVASDIGRLIRLGNASNQWSWGKIASLSGGTAIPGNIAGVVHIGNMQRNSSRDPAFDGIPSKAAASCVISSSPNDDHPWIGSIGQDYSVPGAQQIQSVVLWPSKDLGWVTRQRSNATVTLTLRASNTDPNINGNYYVPPASVILGSISFPVTKPASEFGPRTITSSDTTNSYKYVWVELSGVDTGVKTDKYISSIQFFSPGSAPGSGITIQLLGSALQSTEITLVRLGLYSDTTGWPTCGTYHEGRLWLSGVVKNRIDGCKSNGISLTTASVDFSPTNDTGTVADNNAISYTFNAPSSNPIFWMRPHAQGIICGTLKGEWLVQATANNQILTPSTMQAHEVTTIGSYNAEPTEAEHTIVFIQKYRRKLQEYFADVFSGKFASPNLAKDAKHLTASNVVEIAFQQELTPILWGRTATGKLLGCTYKRESLVSSQGPSFAGWHKHPLGRGTPLDRAVESICVGPSVDGTLSSLAIVSNDPATGIRHVEVLTTTMDDNDPITASWFLDDAIVPSSASGVTLTDGRQGIRFYGLHHLNGKQVTAFIAGIDCGDYMLKDGYLDVPYGADEDGRFTPDYLRKLRAEGNEYPGVEVFVDGNLFAIPVVIGLNYTSDAQLLRPMSSTPELGGTGAQTGPAFGKLRNISTFAINIVAAVKMKFGTSFDVMRRSKFSTQANGSRPWPTGTLYRGTHRDTIEQQTDDFDGMLAWRVDRPYPCTVAAIGGFIETKDVG